MSEPDAGLYASAVLRTERVLEPAALTMGAGLAVRATLIEFGLVRAQLKWPNDLLVDGAKVCGILAETRGLDARSPHCVLGIGVNVAQRTFPPELSAARPVTSLFLCGVVTTPREVLERLLPHLAREIDRVESDPEATAQDYFAATGLADHRVRVLTGESELEGHWAGAGLSHGLALVLDDGSLRRVRLEHVRALNAVET